MKASGYLWIMALLIAMIIAAFVFSQSRDDEEPSFVGSSLKSPAANESEDVVAVRPTPQPQEHPKLSADAADALVEGFLERSYYDNLAKMAMTEIDVHRGKVYDSCDSYDDVRKALCCAIQDEYGDITPDVVPKMLADADALYERYWQEGGLQTSSVGYVNKAVAILEMLQDRYPDNEQVARMLLEVIKGGFPTLIARNSKKQNTIDHANRQRQLALEKEIIDKWIMPKQIADIEPIDLCIIHDYYNRTRNKEDKQYLLTICEFAKKVSVAESWNRYADQFEDDLNALRNGTPGASRTMKRTLWRDQNMEKVFYLLDDVVRGPLARRNVTQYYTREDLPLPDGSIPAQMPGPDQTN